jgi:hypothetical protein
MHWLDSSYALVSAFTGSLDSPSQTRILPWKSWVAGNQNGSLPTASTNPLTRRLARAAASQKLRFLARQQTITASSSSRCGHCWIAARTLRSPHAEGILAACNSGCGRFSIVCAALKQLRSGHSFGIFPVLEKNIDRPPCREKVPRFVDEACLVPLIRASGFCSRESPRL